MGTKVKLKNVRLFFNDLFKAVEFKAGDGRPRFSATVGISKTDKAQIAVVEAAILEVATEAWKGKAKAHIESYRNDAGKFCFKDGDKQTWDGAEGCMVLAAHRQAKDGRPYVVDQRKVQVDDDGTIYSGCYVNASMEIWAQTGENPGIRCGLLGIQKCGEGDAFTGASKADPNDFDDLGDGTDDEDLA